MAYSLLIANCSLKRVTAKHVIQNLVGLASTVFHQGRRSCMGIPNLVSRKKSQELVVHLYEKLFHHCSLSIRGAYHFCFVFWIMVMLQGVAKALVAHGNRLKHAVLQHLNFTDSSTPRIPHKGLENITVSELLKSKGEDESQVVYFCRTSDGVYHALQNMVEHNVGSLVVLKPGDDKLVAGIVTERDYLRKIIMQGKSATSTRVGDIMTDENKLITVNSDTNIVKAMQLMTDNHIRHVPVIDKRLVGMISIVDVVRIIIEQQHQEMKSLNEYIRGNY